MRNLPPFAFHVARGLMLGFMGWVIGYVIAYIALMLLGFIPMTNDLSQSEILAKESVLELTFWLAFLGSIICIIAGERKIHRFWLWCTIIGGALCLVPLGVRCARDGGAVMFVLFVPLALAAAVTLSMARRVARGPVDSSSSEFDQS